MVTSYIFIVQKDLKEAKQGRDFFEWRQSEEHYQELQEQAVIHFTKLLWCSICAYTV